MNEKGPSLGRLYAAPLFAEKLSIARYLSRLGVNDETASCYLREGLGERTASRDRRYLDHSRSFGSRCFRADNQSKHRPQLSVVLRYRNNRTNRADRCAFMRSVRDLAHNDAGKN